MRIAALGLLICLLFPWGSFARWKSGPARLAGRVHWVSAERLELRVFEGSKAERKIRLEGVPLADWARLDGRASIVEGKLSVRSGRHALGSTVYRGPAGAPELRAGVLK